MSRESFPRSVRKEEPEERQGGITRREAFAGKIALGATLALGADKAASMGVDFITGKNRHEHKAISPDWWKNVVYPVSAELRGKSISPLELAYINPAPKPFPKNTGEKEPPTWPLPPKDKNHPDIPAFPDVFPPIDFAHNLEKMIASKKHAAKEVDMTNLDEQIDTFDTRAEEYRDRWERNQLRRMNLKQFQGLIGLESMRARVLVTKGIPKLIETYFEPAIAKDERLSDDDKVTLALNLRPYLSSLAEHITPKVLLAYIATEIMPTPDRSLGMLEFITKNAGVEYLERIPALGDSQLSYGPFQLTPYVVGQGTAEDKSDQGSVTHMLELIGEQQALPSSLSDFTAIEHHIIAGYLFAFQNIMLAARELVEERRYDQLKMLSQMTSVDAKHAGSTVFVEYVSAAHHRPNEARTALLHALEDNKKLPTTLRNPSLEGYFPHSPAGMNTETYANKTRENYAEVENWFG